MSVHIGDRQPEPAFLIEPARGRIPAATLLSLLVHAVLLAAVMVGVHRARTSTAVLPLERERMLSGIIWIPQAGKGGGGGGSGNQTPAPPGKVVMPGKDTLTVPVRKPRPAPLQPPARARNPTETGSRIAPPPIAELDISALATAAGTITRPGAIDGVPGSESLGPGTGGRAGSGDGSGEGEGRGPGRGRGSGGNQGGGPMQPGTPGLLGPKVVREVKPAYTAEAMRAKIQGTAVVECVVLPDGTVGDVEIARSVDPTFGLDREAAKAARRWLFQPATFKGQPVAMRVSIELIFVLR